MKKIINLIFDRLERLMWQRHVLWTLRSTHNCNGYLDPFRDDAKGVLGKDLINWISVHMNDYKGWKGNATGTENSTEVNEDRS